MIRLTFNHLDHNEILEIDGDYIEIGRSRKATVRVKDTAVSGEHCYLMRLGDKWMIVDLNSRNGTYLNGKRVSKERFKQGDTLGVGRARITFDQEIEAGAPPVGQPKEGEVKRILSPLPPPRAGSGDSPFPRSDTGESAVTGPLPDADE